jgi:hypothetical protein
MIADNLPANAFGEPGDFAERGARAESAENADAGDGGGSHETGPAGSGLDELDDDERGFASGEDDSDGYAGEVLLDSAIREAREQQRR